MPPIIIQTAIKNLPIILVAAIVSLMNGCNANTLPTANSLPSNSIIQILVSEEDDSWNCIIKGDNALDFSAINHISPTGVLLYFPNTTLGVTVSNPAVSAHEIFGSIEANEFTNGHVKNSRILIGLKMDRPYHLAPDENGIKIAFPKTLAEPVDEEPINITAETNTVAADEPDFSSAGMLNSVTATPLMDHVIVNVTADRTIARYDSFTIENPARIVFDIYDIKSPHKEARTIAVGSQRVQRIRYNPYPDKIRLVLDTEKQYLAEYFSFPTDTGMLIYVGRMPEPLKRGE